MDLRTFDFSTDTYSLEPKKRFVRGERFVVSHSIWRRIFKYVQKVTFFSDLGYVFEDKSSEVYYQLGTIRCDLDIRNKLVQLVPNTFLILTLVNDPSRLIFNRSFLKAQQFLANLRGIIKGLSTIAYIINYIFVYKLLSLY
jgi:hypothetical protein